MWRYCGPFLFLAAIPALYYLAGPAAPLASIAVLLLVLCGAEFVAKRTDAPEVTGRGFRLLVLLYIPLQLIATGWALAVVGETNGLGFAALALSLGVTTGVFGVLAAHEAIHSGKPGEALLGAALLTGMCYRHFRIAHLQGHHRRAATREDAATARLGESFYAFFIRTLAGQFAEAWRFERRRGGHRMAWDIVVTAALFATIALMLGLRALLFFLCESLVAIVVLELFNYIAHYGLERRRDAHGRLERLAERHSWNSSNVLANALIFNMGRHTFHHSRPADAYQTLQMCQAPELPLGYAGSILVALVPSLWRRMMDGHVRQWRNI